MAELLEAGLATTAIGKHLGGRSSRSVWDAMRRYELDFPAGSPHFYARASDGKVIRAGVGRPWSIAEREQLTDLAKQRLTAAAIAKKLGRSAQAVAHQRRSMGLSHYAPPPGRSSGARAEQQNEP